MEIFCTDEAANGKSQRENIRKLFRWDPFMNFCQPLLLLCQGRSNGADFSGRIREI
jgi:hypothetical protein